MTISHNATCVFIHPIRAEGKANNVSLSQLSARLTETFPHPFATSRFIGSRKLGSMQPTVPQVIASLKKATVRKSLIKHGLKGKSDAFRVVNHSERIHFHLQPRTLELSANMRSKAGTNKQKAR
jgi:hypothetical protein